MSISVKERYDCQSQTQVPRPEGSIGIACGDSFLRCPGDCFIEVYISCKIFEGSHCSWLRPACVSPNEGYYCSTITGCPWTERTIRISRGYTLSGCPVTGRGTKFHCSLFCNLYIYNIAVLRPGFCRLSCSTVCIIHVSSYSEIIFFSFCQALYNL